MEGGSAASISKEQEEEVEVTVGGGREHSLGLSGQFLPSFVTS